MIEVDSAQREARAREMRHELVAQITVGTHRIFRILFAVQWPIALALAWNSAVPGDGRIPFTLILGGTLCLPAMLFASAAPHAWWVRHFVALCQIGWSMMYMWLLEGHSEAQFHMFVSIATRLRARQARRWSRQVLPGAVDLNTPETIFLQTTYVSQFKRLGRPPA